MKQETQFLIAKEGFIFIGIGMILTLVGGILSLNLGIFLGLLTLFCVYFFRDPRRTPPEGEGLLVSPGDGTVVDISRVYEDRFLKSSAVKISIFLNVFNVHINRIPVAGKVAGIFYNSGRFFVANVPKASLENEQNAVVLETGAGKRIVCIQIAGFIARRIVCWIKEGESLCHGERFGLIRFGSRVDLFLPLESEIRISKGDKVVGGKTIVGFLK